MANCLKNLAIKVVNLIVNEAHYHAASIASRSLPALERYQLSSFWKENGYVTTQKLAPLVFGLPEKEIDPPLLLEDCSYEIKDSSKKINIFCSPTTIRAVVQEGDMSGEHSLNPYIVWRYLRNMHRSPSAQPSELDMVARALRALERKPNKTRKEETKLQSFRKRFRILYGAATQKQRDYVDNVDLGGGQRIDSTEAREYLCARIQYLRDFPVTDLPLLDMYIPDPIKLDPLLHFLKPPLQNRLSLSKSLEISLNLSLSLSPPPPSPTIFTIASQSQILEQEKQASRILSHESKRPKREGNREGSSRRGVETAMAPSTVIETSEAVETCQQTEVINPSSIEKFVVP
ncbi:hypothetical protein F2Q68_00002004 [Brassica cretica]|uniref:Uncharacterized protein n=1 Tax=Brassica cretica TaxID=69181 RepID=A0A8S9JK51_BRACR|nr:hypothetical protein F2Q68_00002004 [Brassica cretica]